VGFKNDNGFSNRRTTKTAIESRTKDFGPVVDTIFSKRDRTLVRRSLMRERLALLFRFFFNEISNFKTVLFVAVIIKHNFIPTGA